MAPSYKASAQRSRPHPATPGRTAPRAGLLVPQETARKLAAGIRQPGFIEGTHSRPAGSRRCKLFVAPGREAGQGSPLPSKGSTANASQQAQPGACGDTPHAGPRCRQRGRQPTAQSRAGCDGRDVALLRRRAMLIRSAQRVVRTSSRNAKTLAHLEDIAFGGIAVTGAKAARGPLPVWLTDQASARRRLGAICRDSQHRQAQLDGRHPGSAAAC